MSTAVVSGAARRAKPWRFFRCRRLASRIKAKSAGVTSKRATSAKSQTSMGKNRLIMHNTRNVAPIIKISSSVIYEDKIQILRYYLTHD